MATNILKLPKWTIPCSIETNEDWFDPAAFVDGDNNPVALDGIAFTLSVRQSTADRWIMFTATLADYLMILPSSATVAIEAAGTTYAINDTITLPGELILLVTGIGSSGIITSVAIKDPGNFSAVPTNPVSQIATSGSGTGAAFTLTFINNALVIAVPPDVVAAALPEGDYSYEIQASADGYALNIIYGDLTVTSGASA